MMSLEDYLKSHNEESSDNSQCTCCGKSFATFALSRAKDVDPWTCGNCQANKARSAQASAEAAATVDPKLWTSPKGQWLKLERNKRLDTWRWTIMPDSPLSTSCQTAFAAMLKSLQRMTIDCATTDKWRWPAIPALVYPPAI